MYSIGKDNQGEKQMFTIATLLGMVGYGIGLEGFINGKLYVGVYMPKTEYGYVITNNDIYLDSVYTKTSVQQF